MRKLLALTLLFTFISCQSESRNKEVTIDSLKQVELITPSNEIIATRLAVSPEEQEQGVSGIKPDDFSEAQGMLFFYMEDGERSFWMPDTYFDLDLFFLDKDLKIIDIIRKLPFYVGRANFDLIPRARTVWSRHVLEMKSDSKIASKLKVGDVFKWNGKLSLSETEEKLKSTNSH